MVLILMVLKPGLFFLYKTVLGIFKIALHLRDRHVFAWQSLGISNVFNTLTLKQVFWRSKTFLKKLEDHFWVQTTTNESATWPYKTFLSKGRIKSPLIKKERHWLLHFLKMKLIETNSFVTGWQRNKLGLFWKINY